MRFFNLKVGSEDVHGIPIQVDSNANLENRMTNLISEKRKFVLTQYRGGDAHYLLRLDDSVLAETHHSVEFVLKEDGSVQIYRQPIIEIYFSEISEKEALEQKDAAECWHLQMGWA